MSHTVCPCQGICRGSPTIPDDLSTDFDKNKNPPAALTTMTLEEIVLKVYMHCEEWKMWRRLQSTQGDCEGKTSGSIEGVGESSRRRAIDKWSFSLRSQSLQVPEEEKKAEEEKPKLKRRKKRMKVDKAVELRNELASRNPKMEHWRVVVETHVFLFNGKARNASLS
ncbi:hypothetical protein Sjap_025627 [Stephania japonica]|uniref:Uncharacterized protein n=1 Tax=Stephania japonica TaxID=461633 RepID=A0AAP0HI48_9MAGN